MTKSIFCIMTVVLASSALAGESRFNTTRDGAGYEAALRNAGIPLSSGMVWPASRPVKQPIATNPAGRPDKGMVKSNGSAKPAKTV